MMAYFEGLPFFLVLTAILIPAIILGMLEIPLRWYGLATSVLVAAGVFSTDPLQALSLILCLVWFLVIVLLYQRFRAKQGRQERVFHFCLFLVILPLILCKVTPVFHLNIFGFTGISYMTFRAAQIVIETYDGVILQVDPARTLAFFIFFPSFSSGPIDRSRRFDEDWENPPSRQEYMELCAHGLYRFLLGAVYKLILAVWAYKLLGFLDTPDAVWYHHIGSAYAYSLYLFFDFAGYSAMAVGAGCILGVRLPENFRMPFISIDIREFWDRWHISLSHWFRDFVFTRFIMYSTRKKWFGNRLNRACVGFIVNMGLMGLWHGLSLSYILYGLYHGALLALTEIYQKKSGFYKKHRNGKWYRLASWLVTMQMVAFGFYLFSGRLIG